MKDAKRKEQATYTVGRTATKRLPPIKIEKVDKAIESVIGPLRPFNVYINFSAHNTASSCIAPATLRRNLARVEPQGPVKTSTSLPNRWKNSLDRRQTVGSDSRRQMTPESVPKSSLYPTQKRTLKSMTEVLGKFTTDQHLPSSFTYHHFLCLFARTSSAT